MTHETSQMLGNSKIGGDMKQSLLIVAFLIVATTPECFAAACTNASLAGYIALGSTGCTIGNNTLFDFQALTGTSGAKAIAPKDIRISSLGGTFNPGLSATTTVVAPAGTLREAFFTYRISGATYVGDSIALSGSSQTGDGAVTDSQNFCAGGTFGSDGVSGCSGTAGSLVTLSGVQNTDSTPLGPTGIVSVTDDFTIDGGTAGSASGGTITDRFAVTPEPGMLLPTALAMALGIALKLRCGARGK